MIDRQLLEKSDLFGSLLEAYGDNSSNNGKYIEEVPVPAAIPNGVMDDYLNFLDKDRFASLIMQSMRMVSLIGIESISSSVSLVS